MKVKLMNLDGTTQNGLVWGDGIRHAAANQVNSMELCSDTVIHFYDDECLAVVMNPAYGNFDPCIARRFEPEGDIISDGTKSGCRAGTTYEIVTLPEISLNAKIHFGILCALQVYSESKFVAWAKNWINNLDRTKLSAHAAAHAAYDAADAAAYAASAYAASAYAAYAAYAYAAYAAAYAAQTKQKIDFVSLLHEAIAAENKIEKGL